MPATELLCQAIGINPKKFSDEENILLEAQLFAYLCDELENFYYEKNKIYLQLLKCDDRENFMREENLINCVINDILSTQEYTLAGIAYYTEIPEEVIYEASLGCNKKSSVYLLRKIIELHRSVRPELYYKILKKLIMEYENKDSD